MRVASVIKEAQFVNEQTFTHLYHPYSYSAILFCVCCTLKLSR